MNGHQKRVLDLLNEDCRIPLERMAVMLDMDIREVADTIDKLEKEHVILCYRPVVNWDRTERNVVTLSDLSVWMAASSMADSSSPQPAPTFSRPRNMLATTSRLLASARS